MNNSPSSPDQPAAVRGAVNVPVWYAILSMLIITATMGLTGTTPVFGNPSPNSLVVAEIIALGGVAGVWAAIRKIQGGDTDDC